MATQQVFSSKARKRTKYMPPAKSLANLIPYSKGENGHQGGYPLKERLMHSLDKPLKKPGPNSVASDLIVYSTLMGAILREPTPFKEVWDRVEGKVPEPPKAQPEREGARIINIFVNTERAKQLIEGIAKRLEPGQDRD